MPKETLFKRLQTLAKETGAAIPDLTQDQLENSGMTRISLPDGATQYAWLDQAEAIQQRIDDPFSTPEWQRKISGLPHPPFTIDLETFEAGRTITKPADLLRISKELTWIDELISIDHTLDPEEVYPQHTHGYEEVQKILEAEGMLNPLTKLFQYLEKTIATDLIMTELVVDASAIARIDITVLSHIFTDAMSQYDVLPAESSMQIITHLQRVRARLADYTQIEEGWLKMMHAPYSEYLPPDDEVRVATAKVGLFSQAEVLAHTVSTIAANYDQDISSKSDIIELRRALEDCDFAESFREEFSRKKAILKTAKPEERRVLGAELKELRQQIRQAKQIQTGLHELAHSPLHWYRYLEKRLLDLEKFLTRRKTESAALLIDPTPHFVLDRDPGKVSADCTAGRPLRFLDHTQPLYNAKVFRDADHIGNIYQLVASLQSSPGSKVIHLDALQIPPQFLSRPYQIKILIQTIASRLRPDIQAITVSRIGHHISNYSEVGEATLKLAEEEKWEKDALKMPEDLIGPDHDFSAPQTEGEVFIAWQRPSNS